MQGKPIKRGNVQRAFANPTTSDAPVADEWSARDDDGARMVNEESTGEVNERRAMSDALRLVDETEDRE
jgi:hypothetical protein